MHHTQPAVQFTKLYHRRVPGSSIWLHSCTSCRRKGMAANDLQLPKSSSNRNSPAPTRMFGLQPKKQEGWSAALTAAYLTQHRDWRVSEGQYEPGCLQMEHHRTSAAGCSQLPAHSSAKQATEGASAPAWYSHMTYSQHNMCDAVLALMPSHGWQAVEAFYIDLVAGRTCLSTLGLAPAGAAAYKPQQQQQQLLLRQQQQDRQVQQQQQQQFGMLLDTAGKLPAAAKELPSQQDGAPAVEKQQLQHTPSPQRFKRTTYKVGPSLKPLRWAASRWGGGGAAACTCQISKSCSSSAPPW